MWKAIENLWIKTCSLDGAGVNCSGDGRSVVTHCNRVERIERVGFESATTREPSRFSVRKKWAVTFPSWIVATQKVKVCSHLLANQLSPLPLAAGFSLLCRRSFFFFILCFPVPPLLLLLLLLLLGLSPAGHTPPRETREEEEEFLNTKPNVYTWPWRTPARTSRQHARVSERERKRARTAEL